MSVFHELKRRNVFRIAAAYVVASWLIIQVIDTIFPAFGSDNSAVRIAVIVLAVGFVPAVIGAWIFEFTPEGLKLDRDVDRSEPSSVQARKTLDRIILSVLALAVAYFAIDKFLLDPVRDQELEKRAADAARGEKVVGFYGDRSIAVLPFVNLSSDPEQEYFAEGISEEVLNLLARIRQLRVISRSSAFAFKGQGLEIPEIARRLNVAHVLEGSVRKAGNTVRVTAQLIEARTDTHIWSASYDRELENLFVIQDEIAADVAGNLRLALLEPLPKSRFTDPEVVALTAQAKQISEQRPDDAGQKMHALLSKALAIDPDYVPALEWMGMANGLLKASGAITSEEDLARWIPLKQHILELEPDNAIVLTFDAWDAFHSNQFDEAVQMLEDAISNDATNSNAVRIASAFAVFIGHFGTAVRLARHAAAIDPLCYQCLYWVSRTNLYAGKLEEALAAREHYLVLGSGGLHHLGLIKLLQGKPEEVLQIDLSELPEPQLSAILAMAYFDLGNPELAASHYARLVETGTDDPSLLAEVAAWIGKSDEAFARLYDLRTSGLFEAQFAVFNPALIRLHDDPRWTEWRESIDMSEERLAAIQFNPELPR